MKKLRFNSLVVILLILLSIPYEVASQNQKQAKTTIINAPAGISYQWYCDGQLLADRNMQQLEATQSGNYKVVVKLQDGTLVSSDYAVDASTGSVITIYMLGDSTAALYDTSLYPRTGWVQLLQSFFDSDKVAVSDHAASGRSSKSFYNQGLWTAVYNLLKPGDFVFIQFAHNDAKVDDSTRYTNPETTYKDYISIFIKGTIEKGAIPVLISSIPRNNWSSGKIVQAHYPYTIAMKQLADSFQVPFIDMEAATMAYLNSKGQTYATYSIYNNLKAGVWTNYLTGNSDNTHLQENGAYQFCKVVTEEFKKYRGNAAFEALTTNVVPTVRISAMPTPDLKGTITGYGVFPANSTVTITTMPIVGYKFVKWATTTNMTTLSISQSITFNQATTDIDLLAYFEPITATNEIIDNSSIRIFPNPVSDILNINLKAQDWSVDILDLTGRKLISVRNEKQIDLDNLISGIYLVCIKTNGLKVVKQILKN